MPPSIFERLNTRIEADEARRRAAFDLANFSEEKRAVMRILLRDPAAALTGMSRATLLAQLGESSKLREALTALCAEGWLVELGESPEFRYKINSQRGPGIWSALVDRLCHWFV